MKVKCINKNGFSHITEGKVYDAIGEGKGSYLITGDDGRQHNYNKDLFKRVEKGNEAIQPIENLKEVIAKGGEEEVDKTCYNKYCPYRDIFSWKCRKEEVKKVELCVGYMDREREESSNLNADTIKSGVVMKGEVEKVDNEYITFKNGLRVKIDDEKVAEMMAKQPLIATSGEGLIKPYYYHKNGLDPFEYIKANKLDFFEGDIVKYITRHKEKNGIEDLRKLITYAQYMIDNYEEMYGREGYRRGKRKKEGVGKK